MKKKIINGILLVAVLVAASSAFVSCKDNDADSQTELLSKIANLQSQIENLKLQVGPQGPAGAQGPQGEKGEKGETGATGATGAQGPQGEAGLTPFIGDNGNWWIGTTDTGVKAQGETGATGATGAQGPQGEAGLTPFIGDNGNWWIGTTDTGVKAKGEDATFDATEILNKLSELEQKINNLKPDTNGYDDTEIKNQIAEIEAALAELQKKVDVLMNEAIYSLSADWVSNPLFGFNLPVDLKTNILLACYGEAKRDITFKNPLTGEVEPVVEAGAYITNETGNAGKLYVTVNPSNVDFTDKTLQLVNTAGQVAPVTLSGLQPSNKVVSFATRGESAFYECDATISGQGLKDLQFSLNVGNVEETKANIVAVIKERNKETITNILKTILDIFALNNTPALRLQATWGENNHTYSPAEIAAISWKPFGYDFDLNEAMNYNGDNMSALEKLESYAVKHATYNETTRQRIWNFLNRFNKRVAAPILNNVNAAIQPTLLIADSEGTAHPSVSEDASSFTRFKAGEIKLMPTSWTAEIVAPAFKKFVAVVAVDGQAVSADDPINSGYLGKLIPGSITEIPLTIEAGHTYKIQFSAMDYSGNVKNLYYTIRGAK